ncbi:MAG: Sec-independent protein translocase subunit TatA/TatB [Acidimicrobiales bacterium]
MGGLDPAKLLVILVLALVILGPERLPKAARQVGSFWRDFTAFRERIEREVRSAIPDVDLPDIPVISKSGLTGYLTGMMRETERSAADKSADQATGTDGGSDGDGAGPTSHLGNGGEVAWQGSLPGTTSPGAVGIPNGIPASWSSTGAEAPGYASGSLMSALPGGAPEGVLGAEARLDLDDPSWN